MSPLWPTSIYRNIDEKRRTTFEQRIWDKKWGCYLKTSWGTHWELDGILTLGNFLIGQSL